MGDLGRRESSSFEENRSRAYLIGSKRSGMPLVAARGGSGAVRGSVVVVVVVGGRTVATGAPGNREALEGSGANRTARGFLVETRDWRTELDGAWPRTVLRPTGFAAAAEAALLPLQ